MALPNRKSWITDRLRRSVTYGVIIRIVPGDQTLLVEIERAPDSSGAPDTGNKVSLGEFGPFPKQGGQVLDRRTSNGATWWYRCRHSGPGVTAGNWTQWKSRTPRRFETSGLAAQLREGVEHLFIRSGVKGAADVAFGGTVKQAPARHTEFAFGADGATVNFSVDYDASPRYVVFPRKFIAPTGGETIDIALINLDAAGGTIRAKKITSPTSTARSSDFTATQNGTQPNASGVTIGAPSSAAYCNLSNANGTSTTYKIYFDVNTTSKSGGGLLRVTAYKNSGPSMTDWAQIGQATYDDGLNLTGEHIDWVGALGLNYDIKLVVTYTMGTPSTNGSVLADRVDYDEVTGGTELALSSADIGVLTMENS